MISKDPIQFRESIFMSTLPSPLIFSLCWMVRAVLYAHPPPRLVMYMGRQRKASERAELHPFTQVTMRAYCYARVHRRVAGARKQRRQMVVVEALMITIV